MHAEPPDIVCLHGAGRSGSDWDGVRVGLGRYGVVHSLNPHYRNLSSLVTETPTAPA